MSNDDLTRRIRGVGTLTEPVRRALYLFVADHPGPVSRDAAAAGLGVARHLAKFHLDRLVDEGLLEADFQRLTGRTGPGAGRPAKLYRRAAGEVSVSLPERQYRLAGELMAAAIDSSAARGVPVMEALAEVAARRGRQVAEERVAGSGPSSRADRVCAVLADLGYEPAVSGDEVVLRNCPFHALAAEHTALVCGMNLALLGSFGEALDDGAVTARLDPAPGRCCVVLSLG